MSLVDSLLLDPYPFHVWITRRADTLPGSGTLNDPYDSSTQARFDGIMAMFAAQSNMTIHLGIGTFETLGYADGVSGRWQVRPGMKIIGSGVESTVLKIVGASTSDKHYFAFGHPLSSGNDKVNYFEVSDLTVDCNLPIGVASVACGAVRVLGDHVKMSRVKAIHWGTTDGASSGRRCYAFSVITGLSGSVETVNAGIEDCLAILPAAHNSGKATAFHVGSQEDATVSTEGFGKSPYLRNCFLDCGINPDPDPDNWIYHGLSMGWCRGGVVEGNQVYNAEIGGPFQDKRSARDIIVRNNFYKNVGCGPCWNLGVLGTSIAGNGNASRTGNVLTVPVVSVDGLAVGDRVKIVTGTGTFNGVYVINNIDQSQTPKVIYVTTPLTTTETPSVTSVQKVFGLSRAVIDGNVVELATAAELTLGPINVLPLISFGTVIGADVNDLAAVWVDDNSQGTGPDYVHGDIFIRNNKTRYVDGLAPAGNLDLAIQVNGAKNVIVSNNVIDSANSKPMQNRRCSAAKYLNNLAPNGAVIQGFNADQQTKYSEPATDAEDAFVLALLERRARR